MFGFARLARFDYFEHVERALAARIDARGAEPRVFVCPVHPTASIRRRAAALASMIEATAGSDGPIHVVGHSTGGLDARLLASPSTHLGAERAAPLSFASRLRSIVSLNTPHRGTPLASFFATVSGQRLLYAVSALTVLVLSAGAPPLAAASGLLAAFARNELTGLEERVLDRTIDELVKLLDDASSRELRAFLRALRDDQGGIVQLMPEAMDLFQSAVEDREGVRYACVTTFAPGNGATDWLSALRSPWTGVSAAIFTALRNLTAREVVGYPTADPATMLELARALGETPPDGANDGVVPLASQVHGSILWAGRADHLDVVGHFGGDRRGARRGLAHNDWLASGARFSAERFEGLMDRIAGFLAESE